MLFEKVVQWACWYDVSRVNFRHDSSRCEKGLFFIVLNDTGRAKMWSHQMMPQLFDSTYCSDGFFLNLSLVLLRLCIPFSEPRSPKLLRIQPTYCLATVSDRTTAAARNVHMIGKGQRPLLFHSLNPLDARSRYTDLAQTSLRRQKSVYRRHCKSTPPPESGIPAARDSAPQASSRYTGFVF